MNKYISQGINSLKPAYRKIDPVMRDLEEENERFKKTLQDKKIIVHTHESLTTLKTFFPGLIFNYFLFTVLDVFT